MSSMEETMRALLALAALAVILWLFELPLIAGLVALVLVIKAIDTWNRHIEGGKSVTFTKPQADIETKPRL